MTDFADLAARGYPVVMLPDCGIEGCTCTTLVNGLATADTILAEHAEMARLREGLNDILIMGTGERWQREGVSKAELLLLIQEFRSRARAALAPKEEALASIEDVGSFSVEKEA